MEAEIVIRVKVPYEDVAGDTWANLANDLESSVENDLLRYEVGDSNAEIEVELLR